LREHAVILGALLNMLAGAGYLRDTIRGTTQPNRATFFLWALAPMIAFAAEIGEGVGLASLATFVTGLMPALILLGSFINRGSSHWRLAAFDYICGALSLLAIVLWQVTSSGNVAIAFSILSDFLASCPTIVKAYHSPESETGWTYAVSVVSVSTGIISVSTLNFASLGFPVYYCVCMGTIALLALTRWRPAKTLAERL
jgi:hypothetical protein